MDWVLIGALAVGALAAFGVVLLVGELLPATPALGAALHRLHPEVSGPAPASPRAGANEGKVASLLWWVPVPRDSLELLGRTTGQYYTGLVTAAVAGLALPVVVSMMLAASGRQLPGPPVLGTALLSLAVAAGFALIADADVRFKARGIRRQYRQVVAVYLGLVAMEKGAGHGSVESLERAAAVGDGWVIRQIREALQRARSRHYPPWEELTALGNRIGVPELRTVGEIMESSGRSGAQVTRTLLERADSLRDQIRTEALARAEATTGKLEVPGALMLAVLAAFVIYPLTQRISVGL